MTPTGKASPLMKFSRIAALLFVALVALATILGKGNNVAQPSSSEPINIDVQASQVDGDFLLDGGAFPNTIYQSGDLFFRDDDTGSLVELGDTYDDSYDIMLVKGTYDSIYHFFTGGDVPANELGIIQADIGINAEASVNIDVPSASVRPQFLLNGGSFPASNYDRGTFYLQPVNSDELILLGESHIASDIVNVIPGTYHVIYSQDQGQTVPANKNARVMSDVAIAGSTPLVIDVTSVDVRTSFLHNGNVFPNSQYVRAEFFLVNDAGDEVFIGNSYDDPGTIAVISGTYEIEYRHRQGDTIPLNKKTIVRANLDLTAGGDASVDVTSFVLNINPTLNGQAFQVSEYQDGILELRDAVTGGYSLLGNTHGAFEDLVVIPGTYDFAYSHETGDAVPQNTRGSVATGYVISGDQQLDLDIAGHTLTFSVTLDTAAFPFSEYDSARIYLSGSASAEDMLVAITYAQDEPVVVLPGTYDVIYSCKTCNTIPFNSWAIIRDDYDVSASGVIAASISSVSVVTTATLNGNAFPQSIYQSGAIWGGMNDGDAVVLTRTNITTDDVILISGDYQFYYEHRDGDQVPANPWALVGQQSIVAPIN
jgi:hypothetical protein